MRSTRVEEPSVARGVNASSAVAVGGKDDRLPVVTGAEGGCPGCGAGVEGGGVDAGGVDIFGEAKVRLGR